jgi:hypothetical protein
MVNWTYKFKWQYDYAISTLKGGGWAPEWQGTVNNLQKLLGAKGFSAGEAQALANLRKQSRIAGGKAVNTSEGFLTAAQAGGNQGPTILPAAKMRASVLKFLSHVYLTHTSGNRAVWISSQPKRYRHWPSFQFHNWASTTEQVKKLLDYVEEEFTEQQKKDMTSACQHALAWCQKTNSVLALAGSRDAGTRGKAREVVKRWFADPGTTDTDLTTYIGTLQRGFKGITAMLNKGSIILTDWMPLRRGTTQDELDFLNAEAFTFSGRHEGLDVVYIERSFFTSDPGNIVNGRTNWVRIIVHELSHLIVGTKDIENGQTRYAWYGIGPHAGYPGSDCIQNADNWAFFCADAAGQLTEAQRNKALKIV